MLEILEAPDHVGAYRLSGTMTGEDIDAIIAGVEARLTRHEKIGVLADVTGFEDLGLRASIKDVRYSLGKIREWHRFPKEAVITQRHWVRTLIGFASPVIPFVSVRAFEPEHRVEAFAWVGDLGPATG